jgi:hypothetical protein
MTLSLIDRVGCGRDAPTPIAEGLLERSIVDESEDIKEEELRLMAGNLIAAPACFDSRSTYSVAGRRSSYAFYTEIFTLISSQFDIHALLHLGLAS